MLAIVRIESQAEFLIVAMVRTLESKLKRRRRPREVDPAHRFFVS